jgi:hypothetical protein
VGPLKRRLINVNTQQNTTSSNLLDIHLSINSTDICERSVCARPEEALSSRGDRH